MTFGWFVFLIKTTGIDVSKLNQWRLFAIEYDLSIGIFYNRKILDGIPV